MHEGRVLLLGGNFYPEPTGIGKYNGEMIDWLALAGYSCTVVTTYPYYPFWKVQLPYKHSLWYKSEIRRLDKSVSFNIVRCPFYVPSDPTGFKRIVSDFSFFISCLVVVIKLMFRKKFDYVIVVSPPFQLGLLAILYKWVKKAKFLYHIQDLQIDAARDLKLIKSSILVKVLFKIERSILKHADVVSSISAGMIEKVKDKCNKDVILFPNWVDTDLFYPIEDKTGLKEIFGFSRSDKIILYSGAIGEKQGLEVILDAAKAFKDRGDIKLVICGSGPYLNKLKELKEKLRADNVFFRPLQPAEKLNQFLNVADAHLVIQKSSASDLVMPSKLTTILSIGGVAIVTAPENSSLYQIIKAHKIALLADPESQSSLIEAVQRGIGEDNEAICRNARLYAEEFLSIENVLHRYSNHLNGTEQGISKHVYTITNFPVK